MDKLRRERGCSLKTIHDLAGARVVVAGDLDAQNAAVDRFCAVHPDPAPLRIDRRTDPCAGYRAVHVVVRVGGIPVEVQFRTEPQNMWAQAFEDLGDRWGRQIRYAGRPAAGPGVSGSDVQEEIVRAMHKLSSHTAWYEELCCSETLKRMERQISELRLGPDTPLESLPPAQQVVLSGYLAYRAARAEAQGELRRQLDDLAWRAGMEVPRS